MLADNDNTSSVSSSEESESDDDIYNQIVVPSHLVDEAADLSQYYFTNSPLSFEQIFTQERLATIRKCGHYKVKKVPDHLYANPNILLSTPLPPLTFPPSTSEPNSFLPSSPSPSPERDLARGKQRNYSNEEIEPMASRPRTHIVSTTPKDLPKGSRSTAK